MKKYASSATSTSAMAARKAWYAGRWAPAARRPRIAAGEDRHPCRDGAQDEEEERRQRVEPRGTAARAGRAAAGAWRRSRQRVQRRPRRGPDRPPRRPGTAPGGERRGAARPATPIASHARLAPRPGTPRPSVRRRTTIPATIRPASAAPPTSSQSRRRQRARGGCGMAPIACVAVCGIVAAPVSTARRCVASFESNECDTPRAGGTPGSVGVFSSCRRVRFTVCASTTVLVLVLIISGCAPLARPKGRLPLMVVAPGRRRRARTRAGRAPPRARPGSAPPAAWRASSRR